MFLATDTHYAEASAVTAGVLFSAIGDAAALDEMVVQTLGPASYETGAFYRRELPCILALWAELPVAVDVVFVDGYVTLDQRGSPGLGAYLFDALGGDAGPSVIGVAKNSLLGSPHAARVLRGASAKPLFVTSAGIDVQEAAELVARMHGDYRQPTMLKRADRVCRNGLADQ